jgi:endo-1,4-beta-xylanase
VAADGGLRDVTPDDLRIGTAVAGGGHHEQQPYPDPFPNDEPYREVLAREFDSVTPENQLKWDFVQPRRGEFRLEPAEAIVAFAEEHGQDVRGHTLLWHNQNPSWLENGDFTEEELRELLREHIETVVGHFRGRIHQWDVANEVFDDEAQLRLEENLWLRELGVDIIGDAFRWAHEADPDALLFINDYNVEGLHDKSTAYYELVQDLLADDVPIHGFGIQGHLSIEFGFPAGVEANLQRFDELGLQTALTEVDVRMALPDGAPTDEQLARQAEDHGRLLEACLNVAGCRSFTLWGFTDRYSWVPHFFTGEGAANVMDDDLRPRPAYDELHDRLAAGRPS